MIGQGGEELLPAEALHLAESFLESAPISNRLLKPLVLLLGQGDANGLGFDFAGPRITSAPGSRAPSLNIAFANPPRVSQLTYGEIRDRESGRLQTLTYAALLWQLFRALIEGVLNDLVRDLGRMVVRTVLDAIDQTVEGFLNDALHMSPHQVSVQLKAEQLGYL